MKTILILTVGGSHQPLVKSIEENRPDFAHFLCSDDTSDGKAKGSYWQVIGDGNVLKSRFDLPNPDLPNLATICKLRPDQVEIHKIKHFDNLNECYVTAINLIERIRREDAEARVIADYTGGTKSMTAGLAAAALDDGRVEIQLVTGLRRDLRTVTDKTEFAQPVLVWDAQVRRRMKIAESLIARYDYAGAETLLAESALRFAGDETRGTLTEWITLCRAFDAWDKFDHRTASELLQNYKQKYRSYVSYLSVMLEKAGHGFEPVEDLLLNAERRAIQGRYDDAIARIYRSLELTAQIWLARKYGVDTANVEIEKAPESMRSELASSVKPGRKLKIGLLAAWDLLTAFDSDALGQSFKAHRTTALNFLAVRNNSILAHGLTPVMKRDYDTVAGGEIEFIRSAVDLAIAELKEAGKVKVIARLEQFPVQFPMS